MYADAEEDYKEVMAKCYAFDRQLMADAYLAGGKEYAELCALAYRQSVSAFQMSEDSEGELLYLLHRWGLWMSIIRLRHFISVITLIW